MDKIRLTILLVDDEKDILYPIEQTFSKIFTNVFIAHNGIEAKKIIESNIIDVVVTDLNMPDMCGIDLIDWIVVHRNTFIPIVITSGHHDIAEKYLDSGCIKIHNKPIDVRDLIDEVIQLGAIKKEVCKTKENLIKIENVYNEAKKLLSVINKKAG